MPIPGEEFRPGVKLLAVREHRYGGHVVLCKTQSRHMPYVTWRWNASHGVQATSLGHYFATEAEAKIDFGTR